MTKTQEQDIQRLLSIAKIASKFVSHVTIRQILELGAEAIDSCGLNPWCINEGLATGEESSGLGVEIAERITAVEKSLKETP